MNKWNRLQLQVFKIFHRYQRHVTGVGSLQSHKVFNLQRNSWAELGKFEAASSEFVKLFEVQDRFDRGLGTKHTLERMKLYESYT